jgi:hypothetical protein
MGTDRTMHALLAIHAIFALWLLCPSASGQARVGTVNRLETEVLRCAKKSHAWTEEGAATIEVLCANGIELVANDATLQGRFEEALFALAGSVLSKEKRHLDGSPEARVVDAAVGALRSSTGRARQIELAESVLPTSTTPAGTRRAVARMFLHNPPPAAKLSLSLAARDPDQRLALMSLEALVGWNDDLVHAVFVEEIARALGDSPPPTACAERLALAERHLSQVELPPNCNALRHLRELSSDCLLGKDPQRAALAATWTRGMSHEVALQTLAAALAAWRDRSARDGAIVADPRATIAQEMEGRFGVSLGMDPEHWRRWWSDVRAGRAPPPPDRNKRGTAVGAFFGIKAKSKQVVFVLDRSGSMSSSYLDDAGLGTGGTPVPPGRGTPSGTGAGKGVVPPSAVQRWDEAKNQLYSFLAKSPPDMLFDVVLFHDGAEAFRGSMVPVNAHQIAELKAWLARHGPSGGTHLKAGVELALGEPISSATSGPRTQASTPRAIRREFVLLCDGGTAEGPGWVADFVRDVAKPRGLVLHAVQVGGDSDGALEGLAKLSGGDFVMVGH